jgi:para-nitrobenzyl esterase
VVVVTVNHRLNALGYLHLAELGGPAESGNAGMLDLVLALQWVRDNAPGVRRRPGQRHHLRRERGRLEGLHADGHAAARGLFHKAIIQSGPGLAGVPKGRQPRSPDRSSPSSS